MRQGYRDTTAWTADWTGVTGSKKEKSKNQCQSSCNSPCLGVKFNNFEKVYLRDDSNII